MNSTTREKITELKNDRLHGANWLSIEAVHIVGLSIKENKATTVSQFMKEIEMTATAIVKARPGMTSIANYIHELLRQIIAHSQGQKQLNYVKSSAQSTVFRFIDLIQEAALQAAQRGADIINHQDTIITCSYSSTVCTALKIARERAKNFEVIVAESKYNNFHYGEISAEQMKYSQIPITIITDTSIKHYVKKATKTLVGADTIRSDGSLVNGVPTYKLAKESAMAKIPLYAVCETAKFDILTPRRKPFRLEPGFDLIPPHMVAGIITESGIVKPDEVSHFRR